MAPNSANDQDAMSRSYGITVHELQEMMQLRGLEAIEYIKTHYDSVNGLCKRLKTSPNNGRSCIPFVLFYFIRTQFNNYSFCFIILGVHSAELAERSQVFGSNVIPPKPPKTFLQLMWEALQDVTLIVLMVAAVVSLALSLYSKCEHKCFSFFKFYWQYSSIYFLSPRLFSVNILSGF